MTVQRGVWHGEAWDQQPWIERYESVSRLCAQLRRDLERPADAEMARLQADIARMKHVMDQRADIIAEMRKAAGVSAYRIVQPVRPWSPY